MALAARGLQLYLCGAISALYAVGQIPKADVSITLERNTAMFDTIGKQTLLINVTCKVISAKGEPKFALQYIGSGGSDVEIFDRETFTDKFGSYHDGRIRQLMRLPTEGFLYCKVRDDHGRYEITEPIEEVPTDCPEYFHVSVRQRQPVRRPSGLFQLSCVLSSVTSNKIKYFWWFVDETNDPIYIHTETPIYEKTIPHAYTKDLNVTYKGYHSRIVSNLSMSAHVSLSTNYKCLFVVSNGALCARRSPIIFEDPKLNLTVTCDKGSDSYYIITAMCTAEKPAGISDFEVWVTEGAFQAMTKIPVRTNIKTHYITEPYLVSNFTNQLQFVCKMSDSIGAYFVERIFHITDQPPKATSNPYEWYEWLFITCTIVLLIVCTAVCSYCNKKLKQFTLIASKRISNTHTQAPAICAIPSLSSCSDERYAVSGSQAVFREYFSSRWKWKHIQDLSQNPVSYSSKGPLVEDIWQEFHSQDDSWFLAPLYCLSKAYHKGKWEQFKKIFKDGPSLTESTVNVTLWRFGQWDEIQVTTELPTCQGEPRFVKSRNRNVFWSSILQKVIASVYKKEQQLFAELDVHILEDLTGGVVFRQIVSSFRENPDPFFNQLRDLSSAGLPVICRKTQDDGSAVFYSVIMIAEQLNHDDEHFITLQGFCTPEDQDWGPPEIMSFSKFCDNFDEIHVLTDNEHPIGGIPDKEISGMWQHPTSDFDFGGDHVWNNPQYLLFPRTPLWETSEVSILIQINKLSRNGECGPSIIGMASLLLPNDQPRPTYAYTQRDTLKYAWRISTANLMRETRVVCPVSAGYSYVLIVWIQGEFVKASFLLRILAPQKAAIECEFLPKSPTNKSDNTCSVTTI